MNPSFIHLLEPGSPVFVGDLSATALITYRSQIDNYSENNSLCDQFSSTEQLVPAIPVFVWQDEFTPPFRVITRGQFLAMQGGG